MSRFFPSQFKDAYEQIEKILGSMHLGKDETAELLKDAKISLAEVGFCSSTPRYRPPAGRSRTPRYRWLL